MSTLHLVHLLAGLAVAAQNLELSLREIVDQHLVQLLCQFQDAAEDVHFILKNAGTVAASGSRLRRIGWQLNFFVLATSDIELPQITELSIVLVHAPKDVQLAVEVG